MDSPLEKIAGELPESVSGELYADLTNVGKSTALVKIDLDRLEVYQRKRVDEHGEYGERRKNDLQNSHARDWLQITPRPEQVSAAQAASNRFVEFKIDELKDASVTNVLALRGAERRVTATVSGDLRLHGRKARKSARVELLFVFEEHALKRLKVRSSAPVPVSLEEFGVHPRDGAGRLLQTVSEAIAGRFRGRVSAQAPVTFEFSAEPR